MFDFKIKNSADKELAQIYIYGDIVGSEADKWSYDDCCPTEIRDFLKEHEGKDLEIRINSCGGDCFGGIAVANMIKNYKGRTVAYIDGLSASIATVIASACDEIHMTKNSFWMIHRAWTFACGNVQDLQETIEVLNKMDKAILECYSKHLKDGVSLDTIKELMDKETWLCGEEVLEYFNFIIDEEEVKAYAKVNKDFNYRNTPSNLLNEIEEEEPHEEEVCEKCGKNPCGCEEPKDEAEVVVEVEEEVKDEVCPKCGQDPCECKDDKDDEEQRKEQQAKAKHELEYLNALEYLKKFK